MVVFAIILAVAHNNQGVGVIFSSDKTGNIFQFPAPFSMSFFLVAMFMSLYVIYGFDTASTLAEETRNPRHGGAEGGARCRDRGVRHRRDLPVGRCSSRSRTWREAVAGFASPPVIIDEVLSSAL